MSFPALLRIGSLEIVAAFAAFAVVASRFGSGARQPRAAGLDIRVWVRDASRRDRRELALRLDGGGPVLVGRSGAAQIGLTDPEVSRRHARFDFERGVLYVSDCGSSNGTFLNGKRIGDEGIEVRSGDAIDVGNTRITIMETEPTSWT